MLKNKVETLLQQALQERQDLFLIDFDISPSNAIKSVIDSDQGISIEDCMYISRAVEHNLDRDTTDFSLEVLSAGATSNLINLRQDPKHIGRVLKVKTIDNTKFEGQLSAVENNHIVLEWKTKEPKPSGKGKITITKKEQIAFESIKEASVKIIF